MRFPRLASSLADAVSGVRSGDSVAIGGFMIYRRPVALVLALGKRLEVGQLTIVGNTLSIETEFLLYLDKVRAVRASLMSLDVFGLAPVFREKAEVGLIEIVEDTEALLVYALEATRANVPFLPWAGLVGSQVLDVRPDLHWVADPNGSYDTIAVPAWRPDVALIHAVAADRQGNAYLGAERCIDVELAETARTTIVSAETIVSRDELDGRTDIWGTTVDVVVHAPQGAFPTSCYPHYPVAGNFLVDWIDHSKERTRLIDEAQAVVDASTSLKVPLL